ncbi:class I SAM-dependent methyltransferase [Actinocorallia libanotica]|uniref:Class I SAM-dependent methyltransferase n=1 Tax=Actinocorallia libanotica TaxID=46162 RepID=A0ABN1Q4F1_9ACTN
MNDDNRDQYVADEAARFWEERYRGQGRRWKGTPNVVLAGTVAEMTPGRALDLGCGEGGDAAWLAARGWRVTAVDIAPAALELTMEHAAKAGVADRVTAEVHDLADGFPAGEFELVSAQYLQTPFELPRARVLRAAAHALVPGGLLLVVEHGSLHPWSNADPDTRFPSPEEIYAELGLDPAGWTPERLGTPRREATGPGGQKALVTDTVVAVRRAA